MQGETERTRSTLAWLSNDGRRLVSGEYPAKKEGALCQPWDEQNRVKDLRARWDKDCIDLKPDWVSILIGINDTWRRYDSNDPTSVDSFEADYRHILERVKNELDAGLDNLRTVRFAFPRGPQCLERGPGSQR